MNRLLHIIASKKLFSDFLLSFIIVTETEGDELEDSEESWTNCFSVLDSFLSSIPTGVKFAFHASEVDKSEY